MKVLVIPDIHGRKFWRKAIADNIGKVDKVVFLGDYLDPYGNEIEENPELMEYEYFYDAKNLLNMLNDIIGLKKNEPDKYILLTGNHTDSYIWSKFHSATRTDYRNWEKYHKFFSQNLEYFNLVFTSGTTIFSHAGFTKEWTQLVWEELEFPEDELSSIMEIAICLEDTPLNKFDNSYVKLISYFSKYRGGFDLCSSCEWSDLREHIDMSKVVDSDGNIIPIGEDGIYQVFGHTQVIRPVITDKWACLDCRKAFIVDTLTHDIEDASDSSL